MDIKNMYVNKRHKRVYFKNVNTLTFIMHCRPGYLSRYSDWLRAGRYGDRTPVWGGG